MTTQAKYGWAIGLIVAGIVGALPFRNTNPTDGSADTQVAKAELSDQQPEGPDADKKSESSEIEPSPAAIRSRLLPNQKKSLPHFDDRQRSIESADLNRGSINDSANSQIVEQVPNKLNLSQLPNTATQNIVARDNLQTDQGKLGSGELNESPARREMPSNVGPYRMRRVPSTQFRAPTPQFRPASQSKSAASVRRTSPSRQVVHYKLRDGDSLRSIAQRYLGNANRFDEILADNQHILTNGENFLPVGQFITIVVQ